MLQIELKGSMEYVFVFCSFRKVQSVHKKQSRAVLGMNTNTTSLMYLSGLPDLTLA